MIRQFDAQQLSDKKLVEHNLWSKGWRTTFSKHEKCIARCWHDMKRIELSQLYLNGISTEQLEQVILHEIAHALAGPGKGHGEEFRAIAIKIGVDSDHIGPCAIGITKNEANAALKPEETKKADKRKFNRLNKLCPICNAVAVEISHANLNNTRWAKLQCGHLVKQDTIKSDGIDLSQWESASGKRLFPYQLEGIQFLEKAGGRGLVADEPGLGKTIQALGFIYAHPIETTPVLWVCKTTLKLQALKETLDWCGPAFMAQIIESPRSFIIPGLKIYIISMDLLRNMPTEKIEKIGFKTVVADEIQHFKNPDSTRTAELRKLVASAEHFIPLSGTPWKNRGSEYFSVLNMLDATRFPSKEKFKNDWIDTYLDKNTMKVREGGIRNIPAFRKYTEDIVIRRMRDDVLPDLPKINRQIRFIDMEALYKGAYDKAEEQVALRIKAAMIDGMNMNNIAAQIMQLKHIVGLAKVQVAIEDTIDFLNDTDESEKITLFAHHIDVQDNIQKGDGRTYKGLDDWLKANGFNPSLRLYGGRSADERNEVISKFKDDPKNRVLIASTLASGEGLNIQFCQNAMMVERQWNPGNEEQAELRFSRPLTKTDLPDYLQKHLFDEATGKQKQISIRIPYLIADQTVDSMLTEIVERKRLHFRKSMNKGEENLTWEENDVMKELAEMIVKKRYGKS